VFVRATDQAVYARRFDGTAWAEWVPLGGRTDADPGAIAYGNTMLVFQKTAAALQARVFAGSPWGPWTDVATANVASRPEGVVFQNKVYVFVRGLDRHTHYNVWNGTVWSGWTSLEGNSDAAPEPLVLGSDLYVFARGIDEALYFRVFDGSSWSGWTPLGGTIAAVTAAG
jgi:hypothetical protein